MKKNLISAILAVLASTYPVVALGDEFNMAAPPTGVKVSKLWATRYYKHLALASTDPDSVPLLARNGSPIGVNVSPNDFCFGALQGTIAVKSGDNTAVFNVNSAIPTASTVCKYKSLTDKVNYQLGHQAWAKITGNGNMGLGVHGFRLVPFRTIAVDPAKIAIGTVFFIPRLKGYTFIDDGQSRVHDGYVIASDVGGGIKLNHIDLFTGSYTGAPPSFVTSRSIDLFDAWQVSDPVVISRLKDEAKYRP